MQRSRTTTNSAYQPQDSQSAQARWYQQVEYPLQIHGLDRQITLAQARLESYQQRLNLYARYNVAAPPDTFGFTPSNVIPRPGTYAPGTTLPPVKAFSPGSSFSHVLGEVSRRAEEARLELATLVKRRERMEANGPQRLTPGTRSLAAPTDYAERLKTVDAELQLAQFRSESAQLRLQQFDQLSALTYSTSYSDLREKIRLGHLEEQLRVAGLQEERTLLQTHYDDWQQMQRGRQ